MHSSNCWLCCRIPGFSRRSRMQHFKRQVSRLTEPFYLVCSYGDTGTPAVPGARRSRAALRRGRSEAKPCRRSRRRGLPVGHTGTGRRCTLTGDADPRRTQPWPALAVLALTDDDRINLSIAAAARLLHPDVPVICRSEKPGLGADMHLFAVEPDHRSASEIRRVPGAGHSFSGILSVDAWLTGMPGTTLGRADRAARGPWLVYGDGFFAGLVADKLRERGLEARIVWAEPELFH